MSQEDMWRQRLVEQTYGDSLTPGFARGTVAPPSGAGSPRSSADAAPQPFADAAPRRPVAATAPQWSTMARFGWAVAGLLAVVLAGVLGWLAHDGGGTRIVYVPVGMPASRQLGDLPPSTLERAVDPQLATPDAVAGGDATSGGPRLTPLTGSGAVPAPGNDRTIAPPRAKPAPHAAPARTTKRGAASPAVAPIAPVVAAPGFACIAGTGPAARTLCADPTLRQFDEQRQAAFAQVVAHGDAYLAALARQEQAKFVRHRDKCRDDACLTRAYTDLVVALVKLLPAGAATPPICMPQQYTRTPLMNCWPSRLREVRKPFYSK